MDVSSSSHALLSVRLEDLPLQAIHRGKPLSAGTPSPICASPQLSTMRIRDVMTGTPPLCERYKHVPASATTTSTSTPSATPDDGMPLLVPV